ncbi:hypothetical protein [Deinococcus multiflagellatus]|uniref:Transposase n=1 Tax=Deinococcus multiflagellatus TaxID=1656887 RepID=A0ABW1ZPR8_9DEIO|nr:hypothetical protein [Deinococcus multiflagellatus]MBZ9715332.1 hypothetical protein [Deinococcus multiflagellatus]
MPLIGAVGPKCAAKFAAFADALAWIDGRPASGTSNQDQLRLGSRVVIALRNMGVEVTANADGALQAKRLTRKPAAVAKSYKKRRAEFERDLQAAVEAFGPDFGTVRAAAA